MRTAKSAELHDNYINDKNGNSSLVGGGGGVCYPLKFWIGVCCKESETPALFCDETSAD